MTPKQTPNTENKCPNCELKPNGIILVNDVKDPHCYNCGREIIQNTEKSWEERFNLQFQDLSEEIRGDLINWFAPELQTAREETIRECGDNFRNSLELWMNTHDKLDKSFTTNDLLEFMFKDK